MAMIDSALPAWAGLAPVGALVGLAVAVAVADTLDAGPRALAGTTVTGGLTAAVLAVSLLATTDSRQTLFEGALVVDGLALVAALIVGSVVVVVGLASYDYRDYHRRDAGDQGAYYTLVGFAAAGLALMATANGFTIVVISVELASLSSYALVGSPRANSDAAEATLKYFLVGVVASAVLIYGISLVYATTGALGFAQVADAIAQNQSQPGLFGVGAVFVLGGLAFKAAAVPFQFWAPDTYEGAPTPVTALLASASTAAGVFLLVRVVTAVFLPPGVAGAIDPVVLMQLLAVATMTVGNLAALRQRRVKRMLAYSAVGQAGYALIGIAALTGGADHELVLGAGIAHLLVYVAMNTGAFLVVALTEVWAVGETLEDFNGLGQRAPLASAAMTVFLFSMAGLPVGGGFLSKLYLLVAAVNGGVILLAAALIGNSVVSVFYYTRLVRAMWVEEPDGEIETSRSPIGLYAALAVALLGTVLLLPGFGLVVDAAEAAAKPLRA